MDVACFDVGDHNAGVMTLPVVNVASQAKEDGNTTGGVRKCKLSQLVVPYCGDDCQAIAILGNRC